MSETMDEKEQTDTESGAVCHEDEIVTEHIREETNGEQTENVIVTDCLGEKIETKGNDETVRKANEELLEHCKQTDEAGPIVLHVRYGMDEKEKTEIVSGTVRHEEETVVEYKREEASEAEAAKLTLETNGATSKEYVGIRRIIEERWKGPSKELKNASGTRKEPKDKKIFNEYSKTSKGSGTFQESNLQEKEYPSPRKRTRKAKSLHQGRELPMSLENSTNICTTTMNKKSLNKKSERMKMRAASMCITTTTPMR